MFETRTLTNEKSKSTYTPPSLSGPRAQSSHIEPSCFNEAKVVFYLSIVNSWQSFAAPSTSGGGPSYFRGRQLSPATLLCSESSHLLCLHWASLLLESLSEFDFSPTETSFSPCHLLPYNDVWSEQFPTVVLSRSGRYLLRCPHPYLFSLIHSLRSTSTLNPPFLDLRKRLCKRRLGSESRCPPILSGSALRR